MCFGGRKECVVRKEGMVKGLGIEVHNFPKCHLNALSAKQEELGYHPLKSWRVSKDVTPGAEKLAMLRSAGGKYG